MNSLSFIFRLLLINIPAFIQREKMVVFIIMHLFFVASLSYTMFSLRFHMHDGVEKKNTSLRQNYYNHTNSIEKKKMKKKKFNFVKKNQNENDQDHGHFTLKQIKQSSKETYIILIKISKLNGIYLLIIIIKIIDYILDHLSILSIFVCLPNVVKLHK